MYSRTVCALLNLHTATRPPITTRPEPRSSGAGSYDYLPYTSRGQPALRDPSGIRGVWATCEYADRIPASFYVQFDGCQISSRPTRSDSYDSCIANASLILFVRAFARGKYSKQCSSR